MHKELFRTWVLHLTSYVKISGASTWKGSGGDHTETIVTAFQAERLWEFSACTRLIPDLRWAAGGDVHAPKAVKSLIWTSTGDIKRGLKSLATLSSFCQPEMSITAAAAAPHRLGRTVLPHQPSSSAFYWLLSAAASWECPWSWKSFLGDSQKPTRGNSWMYLSPFWREGGRPDDFPEFTYIFSQDC